MYSEAVKLRLREMGDAALARGDAPAFAAALEKFDRLLRLYPQFGDPRIDLTAEPGLIYHGIIRRARAAAVSSGVGPSSTATRGAGGLGAAGMAGA